jgi:hypothetical protein
VAAAAHQAGPGGGRRRPAGARPARARGRAVLGGGRRRRAPARARARRGRRALSRDPRPERPAGSFLVAGCAGRPLGRASRRAA